MIKETQDLKQRDTGRSTFYCFTIFPPRCVSKSNLLTVSEKLLPPTRNEIDYPCQKITLVLVCSQWSNARLLAREQNIFFPSRNILSRAEEQTPECVCEKPYPQNTKSSAPRERITRRGLLTLRVATGMVPSSRRVDPHKQTHAYTSVQQLASVTAHEVGTTHRRRLALFASWQASISQGREEPSVLSRDGMPSEEANGNVRQKTYVATVSIVSPPGVMLAPTPNHFQPLRNLKQAPDGNTYCTREQLPPS